jgi:hypothetical protein
LYRNAFRTAGGVVQWPTKAPDEAVRGALLIAEIERTWDVIQTTMPTAADVSQKHSKLIAYALVEAALGPLFGRSDAQQRFIEAYLHMSWGEWNDSLHTVVSGAGSECATSAATEHVAAIWDAVGDDLPAIEHLPLLEIARSRWAAARQSGGKISL